MDWIRLVEPFHWIGLDWLNHFTHLVVLLLQHLVAPAHLLQLLVHHLQLRLRRYQCVLVLLVVAQHPLQIVS